MATRESKRCPLCALREAAAISDEARQRETGADVWSLTSKGVRLLARTRRQREAASMARYHDERETCA